MDKGFNKIKNTAIVNEVSKNRSQIKKIISRGVKKFNEGKDIIDLVISYFSIFGAVDVLQNKLISVINESANLFEDVIKRNLIVSVNSCVSCTITQEIPNILFTDGIKISNKNIDVFKLFKNNPKSTVGKRLYFDVNGGNKSRDFNVFLFTCIENPNIDIDWVDILVVKFIPYDNELKKPNIFQLKINEKYRNKDLKVFNSDFLNSIILIDKENVLLNVLDYSFAFNNKKNKEQLLLEEEIKLIVEGVINSDDDIIENDENLYTLDTNVYAKEIENVTNTKFGILNDNFVKQTYDVSEETINKLTNELTNLNDDEVNSKTNDFINNLQNQSDNTFDLQNTDISNRINIIKKLFNGMLLYFSCLFLTPKTLLLLQLQMYLILGDEEFKGGVSIKKLIKLLKPILYPFIKRVSEMILKPIIDLLLLLIAEQLIKPILTRKIPEKIKERITQLKTLLNIKI
jgi:hypothetical protein